MKILSSTPSKIMLRSWAGRIFRFSVVGTTAALVYFALIYAMVEFAAVPVMIATAVAYLIVTVENYFLHHLWTFQSEESHYRAFPKFLISNVAGFFINWGVMFVGVEVMDGNYLVVQAISMLAIIVWNLIAGVLWIFGGGKKVSDYGV